MKSELQPLAKNVLIPLGSTAAVSAVDTGIHKKFLGSGTTALIISIEEMLEIMKIVRYLEDSGQLIKSATQTIENKTK